MGGINLQPIIRDTYDRAGRTMGQAMAAAAAAASQATSKQVLALCDVFARDVAAAERQAFFERLGRRSQEAIVASYRARRRGPSGYRASGPDKYRRDAGGKLLNALQTEGNIFEATARGITFLPNVDQLDAEARQWYRLNFGARPGYGRGPQRFEVSISNIYLFSIGFEAGPSEPFRIPRGFWVESGVAVPAGPPGTSEYYPARDPAAAKLGLRRGRTKAQQEANNFFPGRRTARGITAEHWLDAGLRRFTEDLSDPAPEGVGLRGLYFKFYRRRLATVRPTRPPVVHVSSFR